jgi:hypothetical protein
VRSFSVNALLNNTFSDLITRKVAALHQASYGDMTGLKTCAQQDESRPWSEEYRTVTIDTSLAGYTMAEVAPEVQEKLPGERFRTLMADRQQGAAGDTPHRWCEVRAWFAGGDSRQLHFSRAGTKEAMRELQQRFRVPDRCVWQDANFEKHLVFSECAEYGWIACMGSAQASWTHELPNPGGAHLPNVKVRWPFSPWQQTTALGKVVHYLYFSSDYCKDILANLIAGRGVRHEHPKDVEASYLDHLKAEHKMLKAGRYTWVKQHSTKPNHGWDTSVQGIAFALLMKLLAMPKPPEEEKPASAP